MKDENKKIYKSKYFYAGLTAFFVIAACVLFFFLVFRLDGIFSYIKSFLSVLRPIIIGFVIAYLVNPIANSINGGFLKLLKKHKFKNEQLMRKVFNGLSVFGALAAFVIILAGIFYMVIPQFVNSISNIAVDLPGQIDTFMNRISKLLEENKNVVDVFNSILNYEKNWLQNDFTKYVNSWATYFANGVMNFVFFLKDFAIGIMFALYVLFNKQVLAKQGRKILFACMKIEFVERLLKVGKKSHKIFSGFIYGKLMDSFIIGILCFIGVSILKIPYPMLVAVIVGVTNVIPVFGPYIGAIPCAALILLTSPIKCLYFVIFIILLQALDGNFIGPKILGSSTGLSALWVVFAIVVGGGMFGVLGMLVGVPVFAVIYYLISSLINYLVKKKNLPTDSGFYDVDVCEKLKVLNGSLQVEIPLDEEK